jgi:IclR family acetate operon transcriptional repressor
MAQVMQSSLLTLSVLEYVAAHQPVRVAEVAAGLDRPKSTVQRALVTLREAGWIRADGSEWTHWVLTPRVLEVSRGAANELGLHDAAYPVLDDIRREARESGILAVRDHADWVVVDFLEGLRPVQVRVEIGRRFPLHAGAAGKAMFAFLPAGEIEALLAGELRALTERTITSADQLRDELARIREVGYAYSECEVSSGIHSIAAPVFDRDGAVVASMSLTIPESRLGDHVPDLAARLVRGAASITAHLHPRRPGAGTAPPAAV